MSAVSDVAKQNAKQSRQAWRKTHKDAALKIALKSNKKYREKHPEMAWCVDTVYRHKKKGHTVLFTSKDLFNKGVPSICPMCNKSLIYKGTNSEKSSSATLDRINNDTVLTLQNTWIICHSCNAMKRDFSMKDYIKYCKNIVEKFEGDED